MGYEPSQYSINDIFIYVIDAYDRDSQPLDFQGVFACYSTVPGGLEPQTALNLGYVTLAYNGNAIRATIESAAETFADLHKEESDIPAGLVYTEEVGHIKLCGIVNADDSLNTIQVREV